MCNGPSLFYHIILLEHHILPLCILKQPNCLLPFWSVAQQPPIIFPPVDGRFGAPHHDQMTVPTLCSLNLLVIGRAWLRIPLRVPGRESCKLAASVNSRSRSHFRLLHSPINGVGDSQAHNGLVLPIPSYWQSCCQLVPCRHQGICGHNLRTLDFGSTRRINKIIKLLDE